MDTKNFYCKPRVKIEFLKEGDPIYESGNIHGVIGFYDRDVFKITVDGCCGPDWEELTLSTHLFRFPERADLASLDIPVNCCVHHDEFMTYLEVALPRLLKTQQQL